MARRNGKCVTVGYVSTLTGEHVMFAKPKTQPQGRVHARLARQHDVSILARIGTEDWCVLDDHLYPELTQAHLDALRER